MLGVGAGDRHQLLDNGAQRFRLRFGCRQPLVKDHGDRQLAQQRLPLRGVAAELSARFAMPHPRSSRPAALPLATPSPWRDATASGVSSSAAKRSSSISSTLSSARSSPSKNSTPPSPASPSGR